MRTNFSIIKSKANISHHHKDPSPTKDDSLFRTIHEISLHADDLIRTSIEPEKIRHEIKIPMKFFTYEITQFMSFVFFNTINHYEINGSFDSTSINNRSIAFLYFFIDQKIVHR